MQKALGPNSEGKKIYGMVLEQFYWLTSGIIECEGGVFDVIQYRCIFYGSVLVRDNQQDYSTSGKYGLQLPIPWQDTTDFGPVHRTDIAESLDVINVHTNNLETPSVGVQREHYGPNN